MIHILMAAVFNHIFVHLQALLREKDSEMRILLTMYPILDSGRIMLQMFCMWWSLTTNNLFVNLIR